MYSDVPDQAYQPSSYALDPALEHTVSPYPTPEHQLVSTPQHVFHQSMPYQPTPQFETTPPYSEVAQPRTHPKSYGKSRFGPSYSDKRCEDFPETNPFRIKDQSALSYAHSNLSNNFNNLRIQNQTEDSVYPLVNHPGQSSLLGSSHYHGWFRSSSSPTTSAGFY